MIIVRESIKFAFLWSYCHFWTWIVILGTSQWSKVNLNNCSFIWTLSEIFDSSLEIEAFLLSFALSRLPTLFWSQLGHFHCVLLLMDQVVPLCENVEYFYFQTSNLHFLGNCQCVHQGGDYGHHEDMLMILDDVTIGNLVEGLLEFLFFRKFQQMSGFSVELAFKGRYDRITVRPQVVWRLYRIAVIPIGRWR